MDTPASRTFRCLGLGEVLWDLLPGGKQLGGAPANFAYHAHALGAQSWVISRVGADASGQEILERLRQLGLETDGVSVDPVAPTGTVSVALDEQGHASYTIHEQVAWDFLEITAPIQNAVAQADAICFGSLAQRHPVARSTIRRILETAPAGALRIFDINLRQHFHSPALVEESLRLTNVLKLNEHELPQVAQWLNLPGSATEQLKQLAARYSLKAVALTQGSQGSMLWAHGTIVQRPAAQIQVVDTVGAGDSYTAALAIGLLAGHALERILERAHQVAEYVCSQPGATPPYPGWLLVAGY
jgi:fructokinase